MSALIGVASESIEGLHEGGAIAEFFEGDSFEGHAFGATAGFASDEIERGMANTEESATTGFAPGPVTGVIHECDVGRNCLADGAGHFGHPGTAGWPATWRLSAPFAAACHALVGIVSAIGIRERANEYELVHVFRHAGKEFAHEHAGDACGDGGEFAAEFGGGIGFGVPHVKVRGTAGEVDVDDGFV